MRFFLTNLFLFLLPFFGILVVYWKRTPIKLILIVTIMTLQPKKKLIYTNVQREQLLQAQHLAQFSSLVLPLLRPANQLKEEIMSCANITLHAVIYSLPPELRIHNCKNHVLALALV